MKARIEDLKFGDRVEVTDIGTFVIGTVIYYYNLGDLPQPNCGGFSTNFNVYILIDEEYDSSSYYYSPYYGIDNNMNIVLISKGDSTKIKKKIKNEYTCPKCGEEGKWKGMIMICVKCGNTWYYKEE